MDGFSNALFSKPDDLIKKFIVIKGDIISVLTPK